MIRRILWAFRVGVAYISVGTVITQLVILGVIWWKGALTEEKRLRLLAHFHGVNVFELMQEEKALAASAQQQERSNNQQSPLLMVRKEALGIGLGQVRNTETRISGERQRYDKIRDIFDARLEDLENSKIKQSRATVQQTLEVIDPVLAKDLIIQILSEGGAEDATAIMVQMPADRQKKIFAEFTSPEEVKRMNEILARLRDGTISNLNNPGAPE
jgi:hypothetical protein